MVIVGCYKSETNYMIKKMGDDYVIDAEYIIGYIEIDENNTFHTIIINPYFSETYDFLSNTK